MQKKEERGQGTKTENGRLHGKRWGKYWLYTRELLSFRDAAELIPPLFERLCRVRWFYLLMGCLMFSCNSAY